MPFLHSGGSSCRLSANEYSIHTVQYSHSRSYPPYVPICNGTCHDVLIIQFLEVLVDIDKSMFHLVSVNKEILLIAKRCKLQVNEIHNTNTNSINPAVYEL